MDEDENVTTEQALKAEIAALTHENRELELENRGLRLQIAAGSAKPMVYPADMQNGKRYRVTVDGEFDENLHELRFVKGFASSVVMLTHHEFPYVTRIEAIS